MVPAKPTFCSVDPVRFEGWTRVELISILAICGRDSDKARRALVTWIRHKQDKGRSTEHILAKLRDVESKFIKDTPLQSAFRDARAETSLPRSPELALPASLRRSLEHWVPGSAPSVMTFMPHNETSPTITPLRLSRSPSRTSDIPPAHPRQNSNRRISLPLPVQCAPPSHTPCIQIPRNRSSQRVPDSPIMSSPEEFGLHFRYCCMAQPVGPSSHFHGLPTPPSGSPPELLLFPISSRVQAPCPRSQRTIPNSVPTSPSEGSAFPKKFRHTSRSPSRRRVAPPSTSPPDLPLPPLPPCDRDSDLDNHTSKITLPPTPVASPSRCKNKPIRPLPMQPIPRPILDIDESDLMDTIGEHSISHIWEDSNEDGMLSEVIVRQDSPVFTFHDDHATCMTPPPPYMSLLDLHSPPETPTFGDMLDGTVNECGASKEIRPEVVAFSHRSNHRRAGKAAFGPLG